MKTAEEMRKVASDRLEKINAEKAKIVSEMCNLIQDRMLKSAIGNPDKGYIVFNPAQEDVFYRISMEVYGHVYEEFKNLGYEVTSKGDRGISGKSSAPANMSITIKWGK